ncbi:hypothetical protein [Pyrodictium abyssi]|uniref:Antitoxin VbhA domain-containing protein n=1 Tax=Pyrodictium abyssi TaxID=54256 RepID=A0ABN6ZPC2_9CREN|nr:hypothetical protein PABY_08210 [Pyrodictium abyssi]
MPSVWQELVAHELRERKLNLRLFELLQKARDREKAAKIIEDYAYGRISYREALRRLKALAGDGERG